MLTYAITWLLRRYLLVFLVTYKEVSTNLWCLRKGSQKRGSWHSTSTWCAGLKAACRSQLASGLRRRNLDNAFRAVPRRIQAYHQVPIVIVDDVITTGTTAVQVAAALKRCGVREISLCALAATMPRQAH